MSDNSSNTGIGFAGALTILFIGLKLGGVINWSWIWILSPLWIGFALAIFIIIIVAIISTIFDYLNIIKPNNKSK